MKLFLYNYLKDGNRLMLLRNCSLELYETLLICWSSKSENRPNFKTLKEQFEKYKKDPHRYVFTRRVSHDVENALNCYQYTDCYQHFTKFKKVDEETQNSENLEDYTNYYMLNTDYQTQNLTIQEEYLPYTEYGLNAYTLNVCVRSENVPRNQKTQTKPETDCQQLNDETLNPSNKEDIIRRNSVKNEFIPYTNFNRRHSDSIF
jgi:hypothetical protein